MKRWRRSWERYRRQNRFLLLIYLALMVLAGAGYLLFAAMSRLPPEELTNRLLLFLLWWFDLTLIAILLFILLRNVTKLLLERRRGVLGSRFRTKLMLSYVVVILAPTVLLFLLGASLLSHASTSWFSEPAEGMARAGVELAEDVRGDSEARMSRRAAALAKALADVTSRERQVRRLEELHVLLGSDLTSLVADGRVTIELVDPRERALLRLATLGPDVLARPGVRSERFGGTVVVRAWYPVDDGSSVIVGEALPEGMVEAQRRLAAAGAAYETLRLQAPTLTATTVLGFGALSLIVVFAAMWLGLYLARRFTRPLLSLVATTDRVAEGDALVEVPLPAEDEVGLLVDSFNAMVRRLRDREHQLRATVRRLDAVLGAVRTGVLTLDGDRTRVAGNPAAAALLGMPRLMGPPVPIEELREAGAERLVEVVGNASGPVRGSLTVEPGGVVRTLEMALVPLGGQDRTEGWVLALEDMTQLLRAQRQAAWSEVARRIAHQIKNPLTPIRLAAERIARHQEKNAADLGTVIAQGCRAIVDHVQAMQEMVDAFSRYARLPPVSPRPSPLGRLVEQVTTLYDGVRPNLGVVVKNQIGDDLVPVDRELFRQVLANLLDNAVEASPERSVITVVVRHDGKETVVEILDQGGGLSIDDPEMLFQPFFSTKGRGSGVGLALVQRIVTDHGGRVKLEARPTGGVRAEVRIPGGTE